MIPEYNTDDRNWYREARAAVKSIYGDDWRLFCKMLSATSPNATIKANVTLARKAYNQYKATGTIDRTGFITGHYKNLLRCCSRKALSGRKVKAFYACLLGKENEVVVDIWMLRYSGEKRITPRVYDLIESEVRMEAKALGCTPAGRQAEIWSHIRGTNAGYCTSLLQYRLC